TVADRGEARKALGRRCAQCRALRRGRGPADGRAHAVRRAGSAHCRSHRARRACAGHRHEQVGPGRASSRRDAQAARGSRPLAGAGQGRAGRRSVGADRGGTRSTHAGRRRRACALEQAHRHQRAQPLAGRGRSRPSAAGGIRPAYPAGLRYPAEEPAAKLRTVHQPRGRHTRRLPSLPGQQPARYVRFARYADPARAAREEEALLEEEVTGTVGRRGNQSMTETHPLGPARRAAFIFVFITVLLDMLAIGIVVPVLPKLVVDFLAGDAARAAEIYGVFGTVWALMQFLFSPVHGALSAPFVPPPLTLIPPFGLGLDYILMALAPNLWWLFLGRVISGISAASISTAYAYIADVTPSDLRSARFGLLGVAFGAGFVL